MRYAMIYRQCGMCVREFKEGTPLMLKVTTPQQHQRDQVAAQRHWVSNSTVRLMAPELVQQLHDFEPAPSPGSVCPNFGSRTSQGDCRTIIRVVYKYRTVLISPRYANFSDPLAMCREQFK